MSAAAPGVPGNEDMLFSLPGQALESPIRNCLAISRFAGPTTALGSMQFGNSRGAYSIVS
jgi:hypothetical protein